LPLLSGSRVSSRLENIGATEAGLPFSETGERISPNGNPASVTKGLAHISASPPLTVMGWHQ
jgi:hypothetical protein